MLNNDHLLDLIRQTEDRGGGLLLNVDNKPAIVVLTIEKYNELVNQAEKTLSGGQGAVENAPSGQPLFNGDLPSINNQTILVTGGAGYIGAHVTRQLLAEGFRVLVLDNLSAGKRENVASGATFIEGDLSDINFLKDIFATNKIYAVMHLAASVEVEESVTNPDKYFENNVINTAKLLAVMNEFNVKRIIFSSTCAVYEEKTGCALTELSDIQPNSPYGASKFLAENLIKYYFEYLEFKAVIFRYFNASGCEWTGQIRPTHQSHLIPIILEVACGKKPYILINGNDYETPDGTCVRDYVHVLDIANAHVLAINKLQAESSEFTIYNIGTGRGYSVLQMINAAAETLNRMVPMEIGPRRKGDAAMLIADNSKITSELGFELKFSDLETIIKTAWKQMNYSDG